MGNEGAGQLPLLRDQTAASRRRLVILFRLVGYSVGNHHHTGPNHTKHFRGDAGSERRARVGRLAENDARHDRGANHCQGKSGQNPVAGTKSFRIYRDRPRPGGTDAEFEQEIKESERGRAELWPRKNGRVHTAATRNRRVANGGKATKEHKERKAEKTETKDLNHRLRRFTQMGEKPDLSLTGAQSPNPDPRLAGTWRQKHPNAVPIFLWFPSSKPRQEPRPTRTFSKFSFHFGFPSVPIPDSASGWLKISSLNSVVYPTARAVRLEFNVKPGVLSLRLNAVVVGLFVPAWAECPAVCHRMIFIGRSEVRASFCSRGDLPKLLPASKN